MIHRIYGHLFGPYKGLPRTMWVLFCIQIISRMGDFVSPIMALILTEQLGYDKAAAGTITMGTVICGVLGTLVAGRLSDRIGRKVTLLLCQIPAAILIGACGLVPPGGTTLVLLLAYSFFQGAIRPVISATIADVSPVDKRKESYSLSYLGINIGVAIGPVMAGFLYPAHLSLIFIISGTALAIAAVVGILAIPAQSSIALKVASADEAHEHGSALSAFLRRPILMSFCLIMLIINFMYSMTGFGLALYIKEVFPLNSGTTLGIVMSFNAIAVLAITSLVTKLSARHSSLVVMIIGSLFYAVGFGLHVLPLGLAPLLGITLVWTVGEILFSITSGAFMTDNTPHNLRGRFQSFREVITSLGRIFSPMVFGFIAQAKGSSIHVSWAITGACGLLCAFLFWLLAKAASPTKKH